MELKEYQKETLEHVAAYLKTLSEFKDKHDKAVGIDPDLAIDFPLKAWERTVGSYQSKNNGLGEELPNFCLKVPTGGGKTLLATKTIDLIQSIYLKRKNGLVLWIVPTIQIYRQTIASLKKREHPYRQALDISSGGRTLILEKKDRFSPQDVEENLIVLMLMLPSANRRNKETLKLFQDAGGFEDFFPPEGQPEKHQQLLKYFLNLDYFGGEDEFFGKQIKTSLGNVLRKLQPIVVIDEGQKAYSDSAQETIRNFNPSIIVELSATPPQRSNVLHSVKGRDLNKEEMIKLDLHIWNRANIDWKDTLLASVNQRNFLEKKALEYESVTGKYIRPICLIQVERTGRDQREGGFIHAEDARGYLIRDCGIDPDHVAVKSSEQDDIEGIDLYAPDCPIRYIITKQALQEGWDCSFAYILTILTNPSSQMAITQLVGRILRQPFARKTKVKELDESYVFCYRRNTTSLLQSIKLGLEGEGLGDLLTGRVVLDQDDSEDNTVEIEVRERFSQFSGKIYLPRFVIEEKGGYRELSYQMDLVSRIDWNQVSLEPFESLPLMHLPEQDIHYGLGYGEDETLTEKKGEQVLVSGLEVDFVFITRHLLDLVPNPWVAYGFSAKVVSILSKRYDMETIASNLVYIIDEMKKVITNERDRLAEEIFRLLLKEKKLHFLLEQSTAYQIPKMLKVKRHLPQLRRDTGEPIQMSLFEYVPEEEYNEMEQAVAVCLDKQEKLLWWYRNIARINYFVQGWKKNKIYPDFIASKVSEEDNEDYSTIYVIETKGVHLTNNPDTTYKKSVFDLCNELGRKTSWNELGLEFGEAIEFQVIHEDEWERKMSEMFE